MLLTEGSVAMLQAGAFSGNLDTNAIGTSKFGTEECFYANQFVWEEETMQDMRVDLPEFKPILEVTAICWHGTYNGIPLISVTVTDGTLEIELRVSMRTDYVRKRMLSSNGPIFKGRLNTGCRFRLEEYTTSTINGGKVPVVFVERIYAEPRNQKQKKYNRYLCNANATGLNQSSAINPSRSSAVCELTEQLEKLKVARAKLGY